MTIEELREIRERAGPSKDADFHHVFSDRDALLSLIDELAGGWMDDRYDGKLPPEELLRRVRIAEAIVAEGASDEIT